MRTLTHVVYFHDNPEVVFLVQAFWLDFVLQNAFFRPFYKFSELSSTLCYRMFHFALFIFPLFFGQNSFFLYSRRKEEAEEKRTRAKKARMGFMKMLAQNTQIDGRSRWDEAERTLRDDARFKAVPDSSDREDLFNEFVEALTKKEKVFLKKARNRLVSFFVRFFIISVLLFVVGGFGGIERTIATMY